MLRHCIGVIACVIWITSGRAQDASKRFELANAPGSSVSSPVFEMAQDQWLRVDVASQEKSPNDFGVDVFVYSAASKELVGMSDNDVVEPYFRWTAAQAGKYYVILRNTSNSAGTSVLTVMPPGSRGTVRGKLATGAHVKVFYATDREKISQDPDHPTYSSEPSSNGHLEYGVADVSIPRDHRMGELEGPSIYKLEFSEDAEKHVVMDSALSQKDTDFYKGLNESLADSPEKQLFVFVHGFNVRFEDAVRRTAQIKYDLGFNGSAVLYSWPSQGVLGLVSYNKDGRNAALSAPHLRQFLEELSDQSGVRTIHLIAHSMGNRVAVKALAETLHKSIHIKHVALMAPDIDAAEFVSLANAMKASADDVTLYASSGDAALKASETLAGYARAGEGGNKVVVVKGVETIDASGVDTSLLGLLHSYYADNSTILSDLFQLIRGQAAKDRFGLQLMQGANGSYWSFRPSSR